jgi:hypothetical protein
MSKVAVYTEDLVVTPDSKIALTNWANTITDPKYKQMLLDDLNNANFVSDIATAGYDTIIVGLFHVHEKGEIFYNDFPVANNYTYLPICDAIRALKTYPGSTVKTVLVSFGGGGGPPSVSDSDYPNIKANLALFEKSLVEILQYTKADGVDWDYEPYGDFDVNLIARLTGDFALKGYLVTAAPYGDTGSWSAVLGGTANGPGLGNKFAWWNLQTYSPTGQYVDWINALKNVMSGMDYDALQAFIVPGFWPQNCNYNYVIDDLKSLRSDYPYLHGAFIWNYSAVKNCAPAVAAAIRDVFSS